MGVAEDDVVALAWYEAACNPGSGAGCGNAGRALHAVAETDEAFYDALDALDQACLQGYDGFCSDAAWAARDEPNAIAIDQQLAVHARACLSSGYLSACARLKTLVADNVFTAEQVVVGLRDFALACADRDAGACVDGYRIAVRATGANAPEAVAPFVDVRGINTGGLVRTLFDKTLTRWATEPGVARRDATALRAVMECRGEPDSTWCQLLRSYVHEHARFNPPPCDDRPAWLTLIDESCAARSVGAICVIDATQLTCPAL